MKKLIAQDEDTNVSVYLRDSNTIEFEQVDDFVILSFDEWVEAGHQYMSNLESRFPGGTYAN